MIWRNRRVFRAKIAIASRDGQGSTSDRKSKGNHYGCYAPARFQHHGYFQNAISRFTSSILYSATHLTSPSLRDCCAPLNRYIVINIANMDWSSSREIHGVVKEQELLALQNRNNAPGTWPKSSRAKPPFREGDSIRRTSAGQLQAKGE